MDWDTLKAECLACRRCELCTGRTHVVFGQGVQTAEVLFVGEGLLFLVYFRLSIVRVMLW